ncbi:MAG: ATP-dependent 6-phosphofructokinase [Deltaproteobacteria bacterium]|nr:ATP-dependent 6-phosphofructokinase [Deltaproteobacteria bacterium]
MGGKRRIGILTGGGDCPGLNPVIRAVVKRGVTQLGYEVIGVRDSFNGLLSSPYRIVSLERDAVRGILTKGGTILGTTNRGDPFAFPVKNADGSTASVDRSDEVVEALRILEVEGLIVIGGDGTIQIAHRFMEKGVNVVAVPKTIDNDIAGTDLSFGFNTAVEVATEAIDRLHSTAESHDRVMVIEVMGRDCGWIALQSGIAGGADVVLIPEIPYDLGRICDKVRRRQAAGRFFSIIVVAEGAVEAGGDQVYMEASARPGAKRRLGGAGAYVAQEIERRTRIESRVTVLGHLQRGGTPNGYDRLLATRFGVGAMSLIEEGKWGHMTALRGTEVVGVPIEEIVGKMRNVDVQGQTVRTAKALGIELGG